MRPVNPLMAVHCWSCAYRGRLRGRNLELKSLGALPHSQGNTHRWKHLLESTYYSRVGILSCGSIVSPSQKLSFAPS
jgi:hypothetical protein